MLIVLAMAVGIAVQVFIGSLTTGLQAFLIETTLGSSPHLIITSAKTDGYVALDKELQTALRKSANIKWILPECNLSAVIARGSLTTPLSIQCGDPQTLDEVYKISPKIKKGLYILGDNKVVIGTIFAEKYRLVPGRNIFLTLPGKPAYKLTVSGIADFGTKQLNETLAFSDDRFGQAALSFNADQYSIIAIQLKDVFKSTTDAAAIKKADKHIKVADWQVEQKDLLSGLRAQSSSTLLIQFFLIIAVASGIASTFSISAIQESRHTDILNALGLTEQRRAGLVLLWQGLILGLLGATGGLLLGIGLISVFTLPSAGNPGSFPIHPRLDFLLVSFAVGVLVAIVFSILPYRLADKKRR